MGDILGHASEIIRAQSQKLKRELDHEIDRQLSVKIKAQEKAITSLKNGIQTLRSENDQLYDKADGKLEELDGSVSRLRRLASDLIRMKEEGDVMEGDCRDITTKINRTASTISHSMTNLNQLVETKRSDTRIITEDVKLSKIEMENHHSVLERELEENQMKINK